MCLFTLCFGVWCDMDMFLWHSFFLKHWHWLYIACTLFLSVSSFSVSVLFARFSSVLSNALEKCVPLAWCISVDLLVTNGMSSLAPVEQRPPVSLLSPTAPALVGLQRFKGVLYSCAVLLWILPWLYIIHSYERNVREPTVCEINTSWHWLPQTSINTTLRDTQACVPAQEG